MVRSRTSAAALVEAGHVRVNGVRVTSSGHMVRQGDALTVALDRSVRVIAVEGFCERRGGPQQARTLYRDVASQRGV
ncbi:MAG: RNA-binding S4 domain-containing protein [Pseudolabrys sp.]|nr:RNA-binding S4 domain-containing protein [Pseudolabrys sp.]